MVLLEDFYAVIAEAALNTLTIEHFRLHGARAEGGCENECRNRIVSHIYVLPEKRSSTIYCR